MGWTCWWPKENCFTWNNNNKKNEQIICKGLLNDILPAYKFAVCFILVIRFFFSNIILIVHLVDKNPHSVVYFSRFSCCVRNFTLIEMLLTASFCMTCEQNEYLLLNEHKLSSSEETVLAFKVETMKLHAFDFRLFMWRNHSWKLQPYIQISFYNLRPMGLDALLIWKSVMKGLAIMHVWCKQLPPIGPSGLKTMPIQVKTHCFPLKMYIAAVTLIHQTYLVDVCWVGLQ